MNIQYRTSKNNTDADTLCIGCFEDKKELFSGGLLSSSDAQRVRRFAKEKNFQGRAGEFLYLYPSDRLGGVLLVGLGKRTHYRLDKVRKASARLVGHSKSLRQKKAAIDIETFVDGRFSLEDIAGALVEGARLSNYRFIKYKSKHKPLRPTLDLQIVNRPGRDAGVVRKAIGESELICRAVAWARDVANEPANVMTPEALANEAKKMASQAGLSCEILGRAEIKRLKMGGLLAVSQGSVHPPRFIVIKNKAARSAAPVVLVGKGITFDSGGISIKPSGDMDKMKFDMCGAAAVMGAAMAVGHLGWKVPLVVVAPVCENMPSGSAQRPGDIIRAMNGKTIEVLNTDAEGRLILADALAYVERFKPRALIDLATLTGACAATFADIASGLMSTEADLSRRIKESGEYSGERVWELPLWDEYFDLIKANNADIQNISKKYAGTITAGMFLKEFAGHAEAWAHLDIAGTAWADAPKPLSPIGATGIGVRLLVHVIKSYARR